MLLIFCESENSLLTERYQKALEPWVQVLLYTARISSLYHFLLRCFPALRLFLVCVGFVSLQ